MSSFIAFTTKEMLEFFRTYKILILTFLFLFLGCLNPITAKVMPELVKTMMPEGMVISLPPSTILDCWTQFFKNVPQMGIIIMVIVFSGIMSNELLKGTLINVLTKGLNRKTVIFSKFTAASLIWTLCYYLSFLVTLLYSKLLWTHTNVSNLFFSVLCVWIFGLFLISALILGGILFKNNYGGLLLTGILVICMFILNMLPSITKYNPIRLVTTNMAMLTKDIEISELFLSSGVCIILTIFLLALSIVRFNKTQI